MSSLSRLTLTSSHQLFRKDSKLRLPVEQATEGNTQSSNHFSPDKKTNDDQVTLSEQNRSDQLWLLQSLFGRKVSERTLNIFREKTDDTTNLVTQPETELVYYSSHYYETEHSLFNARGQLTLSDGSSANINLSLHYQRDYESHKEQLTREREVYDPLVINLSSKPMSLLQDTFTFDLDMDKQEDQLAKLSANAAFIAIDKNHNGTIDNGSELFGAQSGNGFAELALFDQDKNGYINKHDSIFSDLILWRPGDQGEFNYLSQSQVDTLSLTTADTEFRFTDDNNQTLGQMRKSAIYANNDGSAGALHQIDLAI